MTTPDLPPLVPCGRYWEKDNGRCGINAHRPLEDGEWLYTEAAIAPYKAEIERLKQCAAANYRSLEQYEAIEERAEQAEAALAAEREACAQMLDDRNYPDIAADIRARGTTGQARDNSAES